MTTPTPLVGLSAEEIEKLEADLLRKVPAHERVGNTSLRRGLEQNPDWTEDVYWAIRNRLINSGKLELGRGRGGSVRLVSEPAEPSGQGDEADLEPLPASQQIRAERELYEPMSNVVRQSWAREFDLDPVIVEITASGGRRPDGKWSRPDLTLASYSTYLYVPGRHFELITFEIKPCEGLDVTVVYEALAHRRAATRSYALLHIPQNQRSALADVLDEICQEAKRYGIGVIVAEEPGNYDTWEELAEGIRQEPESRRLNDFLSRQVSQGFRDQILTWLR